MEHRFEVRKRELLEDAQIKPGVFKAAMERLVEFAQPFLDLLWRKEQKAHGRLYLEGLLSDVDRKNVESIAYRHDQDRRGLQHFVGESAWDHRPLLTELARQVGREIGESDGVIVFDPSGFKKYGNHSVGVDRQWLGRLGKVDNGQVGVYMGYVSRKDHALVDERLYLSKKWARGKKRRRKCGVPKEVRFQTRHEMALEMLREKGSLLPHAWIAGDDEMGKVTWFRRALREMKEGYVLAVPGETLVRDLDGEPPPWIGQGPHPKRPFERVDHWAAAIPAKAWKRFDVRDGEKGPLVTEIAVTRVVARTEHSREESPEELLVVMRSPDENGKLRTDYYLANAPMETPVEELARVAKAEHQIEDCLKRAKSEAGLAEYEVRTWDGWHHHQTLSIIATWFLACETRRGKKEYAGDDAGRASIPVVGAVA
jgi:SRSO17 transposase